MMMNGHTPKKYCGNELTCCVAHSAAQETVGLIQGMVNIVASNGPSEPGSVRLLAEFVSEARTLLNRIEKSAP